MQILKIFNAILRDVTESPLSKNADGQMERDQEQGRNRRLSPTRASPAHVAPATNNKRLKHTSLKNSLLHSILYDSSFHSVLLSIVGIGTSYLERLISRRKIKESELLEKLLVKAFVVLERVLLSREANRNEGNEDALTMREANLSLQRVRPSLVQPLLWNAPF